MSERIPVIFDTDIGIDDAYALLIAAGSPALKLLGITTVFGNTSLDNCSRNALQICELLGLDVPVAAGARKALMLPERVFDENSPYLVHGRDGLGDISHRLPTPTKKLEDISAVELMAKLVRESEEKVVLIPVGPLTNIAIFLLTYPELHERIDGIALMGGSAYQGNALPRGEANIVADPEAAQVVFQSGIKIMMAGLEVTNTAYITKEDRELFRIVGGRVGEIYCDMVEVYSGFHARSAGFPERTNPEDVNMYGAPNMHDSVAVAWLIDPNIVKTVPAFVQVDLDGKYTRGCTATDLRQGPRAPRPNVMFGTEIDREAFVKLHTDAFRVFADR